MGSALALLLVSCAAGGSAPRPTDRMARLGNSRTDVLNIGYQAYQQHCIRCHQTVPKPPLGRQWHPPEVGMALYNSLTDNQRYGLLEYLKAVDAMRFKPLESTYEAY